MTSAPLPTGSSTTNAAAVLCEELGHSGPRPYLLFVLSTSLVALLLLGIETLAPLDDPTRQLLMYLDTGICTLFFFDFIVSLATAQDRWRYFSRWGWLDLVSSIPAIYVLRLGRAVRLIRILRVLRGVRATRLLSQILLERRSQAASLAAALVALLVVMFASVAILHFEHDFPGANIHTAEDAVWWSLATIATVGYGDKYPISTEGRFVGILLMTAGVGLFATLSGSLAAWFLGPRHVANSSELDEIRSELRELRRLLEGRSN